MNVSRTNLVLAILLVILALLTAAIEIDYSQPNVEFLPEMKRSPASDAFAASAVFANGRTLQLPVAGTIARGELPLHYAPTKEDAVRAGEELQNPYTIVLRASTVDRITKKPPARDQDTLKRPGGTSRKIQSRAARQLQRRQASIQRGDQIYRVSCVPCHGPTGAGDGLVTKRGFPPPPPLTTGKSVKMKDGQLFHILTYGQGNMAPMAGQLSRSRRWDVINHVRGLQNDAAKSTRQAKGTSTTPPAVTPAASDRRSGTEKGKP